MEISSRKNQEVQEIVRLRDKKYRDKTCLYLIEGEKSVREAISANVDIVKIVGTEELLSSYADCKIPLVFVTAEIADYMCDAVTPQGIVAVAKKPDNRLIAPLCNSILLDNVQDPGNVGTIIRTAVALGIKDIYLISSADPYSPKTVRASMSGIFNVEIHTGSYQEVLECLNGVPILSGDMHGEDVFYYKPPKKFCLAIGSEGKGLSDVVRKASSVAVKIPMSDKMESLNAGVSASILLYQLTFNQKGDQ